MKHSEIQILVSQCSHLPVEREEAVAVGNHAPPPLVHDCGHHSEEGEDEEDEGLSLSDQVPDGKHREGQWVCEQRVTGSSPTDSDVAGLQEVEEVEVM